LLFDILTLFPEMFPPVLGASIFKRGVDAGHVRVRLHNIRSYTTDRHHTVDDYPFGGGAGMVLKPDPVFRAVEWVATLGDAPAGLTVYDPPDEALTAAPQPPPPDLPIVLLSPQGRPLTHALAEELAHLPRILLVCGHYEGFDERIREHLATGEISVGDYVLTGGELAAMVVADAVARLVPGVLAEGSAEDESHARGLLEYPQYTRPATFREWEVPPVLVSGHHGEVEKWRRRESLRRTLERRPDLLASARLTEQESRWLAEFAAEAGDEPT
jgi:tRNA (guanine37-N1)-methyltransferase